MSGLVLPNPGPPTRTIAGVHEAKSHLSRLLQEVAAVGGVVVARAGPAALGRRASPRHLPAPIPDSPETCLPAPSLV
jgi:hypothetical protein